MITGSRQIQIQILIRDGWSNIRIARQVKCLRKSVDKIRMKMPPTYVNGVYLGHKDEPYTMGDSSALDELKRCLSTVKLSDLSESEMLIYEGIEKKIKKT